MRKVIIENGKFQGIEGIDRIGWIDEDSCHPVEIYIVTDDEVTVPHMHICRYSDGFHPEMEHNRNLDWKICVRLDAAEFLHGHDACNIDKFQSEYLRKLNDKLKMVDLRCCFEKRMAFWDRVLLSWNTQNEDHPISYWAKQPDYTRLIIQ
jgi:hypothetical protein